MDNLFPEVLEGDIEGEIRTPISCSLKTSPSGLEPAWSFWKKINLQKL